MEQYQLTIQDAVDDAVQTLLFNGLNAQAHALKGLQPIEHFSIVLQDKEGNVVGGAIGITYYGALYTDMLWLAANARCAGWGSKIMQAAENLARDRGCSFATVNTMDWEALSFYQKLGYKIEFTREGYKNGSIMYLLRKAL